MSDAPKNYLLSAFTVTLLVMLLLLLIRRFPGTSVGEIELRKADILSDLRKDPLPPPVNTAVPLPDTLPDIPRSHPSPDTLARTEIPSKPEEPGVVYIEDYSEGDGFLAPLARALRQESGAPVRIAFLGDSFIEGDLLTADIREMLQDTLGGHGVGFVPVTSAVNRFRQTVVHDFSGWKTYSIKDRNESVLNNLFILSGTLSRPEAQEARVSYKIVPARRHLTGVTRISLFFVNRGRSRITARINDTVTIDTEPAASPEIQQWLLTGYGTIRNLSVGVSGQNDFYAYGVQLDGNSGIALDNFSDRGNSGLPLGGLSPATNRAFDSYASYRLIVLQYGLNVISEKMYNYRGYMQQMCNVVKRLQNCYPGAGILILGVTDRSRKTEDGYRTMAEVKSLVTYQRQIARECKVAFWDTYAAMGGENSMPRFVEKGWAAKDYTHISAAGGRIIAGKFVKALLHALPGQYDNIRSGSSSPPVPDTLTTKTAYE